MTKQCPSCGGFCCKTCQRANATVCKHFRLGLVTGFEKNCVYCENDNLHQRINELEQELQTTAERDALKTELQNLVDAKRYNKDHFEDDSCFADWVQSRAAFAIKRPLGQGEVK